jgi:hypothetical protein
MYCEELKMTICVWHEPADPPLCDEGEMIPVILQRGNCVFGGWYCNQYKLYDEYDSVQGEISDEGYKLATGFCEKVPHGEYDDYYEFATTKELQCWAYMPEPQIGT